MKKLMSVICLTTLTALTSISHATTLADNTTVSGTVDYNMYQMKNGHHLNSTGITLDGRSKFGSSDQAIRGRLQGEAMSKQSDDISFKRLGASVGYERGIALGEKLGEKYFVIPYGDVGVEHTKVYLGDQVSKKVTSPFVKLGVRGQFSIGLNTVVSPEVYYKKELLSKFSDSDKANQSVNGKVKPNIFGVGVYGSTFVQSHLSDQAAIHYGIDYQVSNDNYLLNEKHNKLKRTSVNVGMDF